MELYRLSSFVLNAIINIINLDLICDFLLVKMAKCNKFRFNMTRRKKTVSVQPSTAVVNVGSGGRGGVGGFIAHS